MPFTPAPVDTASLATKAEIPVAATTAPPSVSTTSAAGSDDLIYARADHTHASKTRRMVQAIPAVSTYVWTYPTSYAPGVVPMCNGIAQVAQGNTDLFNVQILGTPTNTQCTFQINRVSAGLLGLLLGALSINPTPAAITLHMWAVEP